MNYTRFSKRNFDECGVDTPAARRLANRLQDEMARELHPAILKAFLRIVEKLNAHGHNLKPYGRVKVGDIGFRHQHPDGSFRLRLGCDVVVSAGYAHVVSAAKAEFHTQAQWDQLTGHAFRNGPKAPNESFQATRRKRRARERRR